MLKIINHIFTCIYLSIDCDCSRDSSFGSVPVCSFFCFVMSSQTKRKRAPHRVEITTSAGPVLPPPTAVSRHLTLDRSTTSSRLRVQTGISEIELSAEDIAVLQEHAEFCVPAESFLDFEQSVQDSLGPDILHDNTPPATLPKSKERVSVHSIHDMSRSTFYRSTQTPAGSLFALNSLMSSIATMAVQATRSSACTVMPKHRRTINARSASGTQCFVGRVLCLCMQATLCIAYRLVNICSLTEFSDLIILL